MRWTTTTLLAGLTAGIVMSASGTAHADDSSLEEISASTSSAVVYLETTWSGQVTLRYKGTDYAVGNKPFTTTNRCSGFVVNPNGFIVTAGHCVEYSSTIDQRLIYQAIDWENQHGLWGKGRSTKALYKLYGDLYHVSGEHGSRPDRSVATALGISVSGEDSVSTKPARVLSLKSFDKGDVALLKVEAENLPSVMLAPEDSVEVGTQVVSVGFPASVDMVTDPTMDPSYKDGTISSIKPIQHGLLTVYEISSQMSGGMSGGPALDADGQVVGLNSFGIVGESKGFSFIRPASIINEMLVDEGVANEVGDVQQSYLDGLQAYFAGDKIDAIAAFDHVLAQVPSHAFAQEYRAKAEAMPDPTPTEDGIPLLLVAAVGLGLVMMLVVVTGGVIALVMRARKARPIDLTSAHRAYPVHDDRPAGVTPVQRSVTDQCDGCGESRPEHARYCAHCGTPARQQVLS